MKKIIIFLSLILVILVVGCIPEEIPLPYPGWWCIDEKCCKDSYEELIKDLELEKKCSPLCWEEKVTKEEEISEEIHKATCGVDCKIAEEIAKEIKKSYNDCMVWVKAKCGDGKCVKFENCETCPQDCVCNPSEICDPLNKLADGRGCYVGPDKDGDGVTDEKDDCKDEPGPRENMGCPMVV